MTQLGPGGIQGNAARAACSALDVAIRLDRSSSSARSHRVGDVRARRRRAGCERREPDRLGRHRLACGLGAGRFRLGAFGRGLELGGLVGTVVERVRHGVVQRGALRSEPTGR